MRAAFWHKRALPFVFWLMDSQRLAGSLSTGAGREACSIGIIGSNRRFEGQEAYHPQHRSFGGVLNSCDRPYRN